MTKTPPPAGLSEQELTDFEAWAVRRGYSTRKEGRRYCHVALNDIHAAVVEFKRANTTPASPAKQEPAAPAEEDEPTVEADVRNALDLWAKGEWSEQPAKTQLGRELDALLRRVFSALEVRELSEERRFPEMDPNLERIVGITCFKCMRFAHALRLDGRQIGRKAADEQAATILWMLTHCFRSGSEWEAAAAADMERIYAAASTVQQAGGAQP